MITTKLQEEDPKWCDECDKYMEWVFQADSDGAENTLYQCPNCKTVKQI